MTTNREYPVLNFFRTHAQKRKRQLDNWISYILFTNSPPSLRHSIVVTCKRNASMFVLQCASQLKHYLFCNIRANKRIAITYSIFVLIFAFQRACRFQTDRFFVDDHQQTFNHTIQHQRTFQPTTSDSKPLHRNKRRLVRARGHNGKCCSKAQCFKLNLRSSANSRSVGESTAGQSCGSSS